MASILQCEDPIGVIPGMMAGMYYPDPSGAAAAHHAQYGAQAAQMADMQRRLSDASPGRSVTATRPALKKQIAV